MSVKLIVDEMKMTEKFLFTRFQHSDSPSQHALMPPPLFPIPNQQSNNSENFGQQTVKHQQPLCLCLCLNEPQSGCCHQPFHPAHSN